MFFYLAFEVKFISMLALILLFVILLFMIYFFGNRARGVAYAPQDVDFSLLEKKVLFYSTLDQAGKEQFESDIQYFLSHTKITGVDTTVEEEDRLLVASAAVIPIFYFKEWKYLNLREVLLYSDAINMDFETTGNANRNILGIGGYWRFGRCIVTEQTCLAPGV